MPILARVQIGLLCVVKKIGWMRKHLAYCILCEYRIQSRHLMFITQKILDLVVKTKDESFALSINAVDIAHRLAVGAQANEIVALKNTVDDLRGQLKYERARGDGLVDRLLVRDARVAAVAPAAVAAAVYKDEQAAQKLKVIFDEINSAGVDFPSHDNRVVEMAGGKAVAPGA